MTTLQEYGFWDYTAPATGGMEHYQADDYESLLDDMPDAGMNSLVIVIKWMTTGYRSRHPWLDQEPTNPAVASDNRLIHDAIEGAHRRGIKVWLGAVVTQHVLETFGPTSHRHFTIYVDGLPREAGIFDLDMPGVADRGVEIFREIVQLFPQADGLLVEIEGTDVRGPHRVEPYNRWAREHDKPLAGDNQAMPAFFDYSTYRRCNFLKNVEAAVRELGFCGNFATICETVGTEFNAYQVVNLSQFAQKMRDWFVVTYTYSRWQRRLAMSDFCMVQPKEHGLRTCYLGRGVMTWNRHWRSPQPKLPVSLSDHWRMDVEDVTNYRPDVFWWFGTGAVREGSHVDLNELTSMGFASGRDARLKLLEISREIQSSRYG